MMSYLVTLDDLNAKRLEELAERDGLPALTIIEKIVKEHLDHVTSDQDSPDGPKASAEEVAGYGTLYRWDENRGEIIFTPANRRVYITNGRSWSAVEHDLNAKFSKGAEYLLMGMGAAYGVATARDYRAITGDRENLAAFFEHLGLAAGWGRFQLAGDLVKGTRVTVRVYDCVFCGARDGNTARNQPCPFIVGVCKGIADVVFGAIHTAQETKCRAGGYEFCEVSISEVKGSDAAHWPPGSNPMTGNPLR
jgi:predicted hydrocarbon binding protein